ncbi:MAG: tape measure protein [Agriterribacter sp.]
MNSNTLEFFVRIKDLASNGFVKIVAAAQSTQEKIERVSGRIEKGLSGAFNRATESVKRYIEQVKQAAASAFKLGGGGGSGGLGLLGMAGRFMAPLVIGAALTGGAKAAITAGMQVEKDKVGLTTFLGKQGADAAYANIRKDAAATPYDTASLLMVNRSLISAGVSAENARKDTMNLANAIAAVGGGNDELSRMAANMQQIKTVGKATAMDIRQFAMTGINIYEMLAQATGKPIDKVKEMDVSYDLLSSAMEKAAGKGGMYFGALDAMSKTTEGRFNTLKDTISNSFADLGTKFLPFVNIGLDLANKALENIVGWFSGISINTDDWSGYLDTAKSILGTVWGVIKSVGGFVWSIVSGIVEWVSKSELLKDIFWVIGGIVKGVGSVVMWVVDKLKWVWENVLKPILDAVNTIYTAIKYPLGSGKTGEKTTATALSLNEDNSLSGIKKAIDGGKSSGSASSDAAKGITSGGPRVINISGVKFTDKIEIHTTTAGEAIDELEEKFRMMFARLLNSGAAVQ